MRRAGVRACGDSEMRHTQTVLGRSCTERGEQKEVSHVAHVACTLTDSSKSSLVVSH